MYIACSTYLKTNSGNIDCKESSTCLSYDILSDSIITDIGYNQETYN